MKVLELGEFGLIDLLARMIAASQNDRLPPHKKLILGIGDDAAAWQGDNSTQLATVDSVIENVHFSLRTTTWRELGWKALAVNLSDIAAMGGVPDYALVALALPGSTQAEDVAGLYQGMLELANQSKTAIIGGNTCQAPEISITITVIGSSQSKRLLRRDAAKPGDAIAVTGCLGSAGAGLKMLADGLKFSAEATAYLREAFNKPVPRIAEGQNLLKNSVTAAIDISDGLLADLRHICQASGASARVDIDRLPVHPAVKEHFGKDALRLALGGGEDYQLLFTANKKIIEKVQKETAVTVIGEITGGKPGEIELRDAKGQPVNLPNAGWDHFKKSKT